MSLSAIDFVTSQKHSRLPSRQEKSCLHLSVLSMILAFTLYFITTYLKFILSASTIYLFTDDNKLAPVISDR